MTRLMAWLRRVVAQPDRGTVTFLRDGRVVVGFPQRTTDEMASGVRGALAEWVHDESRRIAVFPFPVDVVDLRK